MFVEIDRCKPDGWVRADRTATAKTSAEAAAPGPSTSFGGCREGSGNRPPGVEDPRGERPGGGGEAVWRGRRRGMGLEQTSGRGVASKTDHGRGMRRRAGGRRNPADSCRSVATAAEEAGQPQAPSPGRRRVQDKPSGIERNRQGPAGRHGWKGASIKDTPEATVLPLPSCFEVRLSGKVAWNTVALKPKEATTDH